MPVMCLASSEASQATAAAMSSGSLTGSGRVAVYSGAELGVTVEAFPQARFEVGVHPERVDRVHPDAVLAELVGEGLGQAGDAVLGRDVVGQQGQADQPATELVKTMAPPAPCSIRTGIAARAV